MSLDAESAGYKVTRLQASISRPAVYLSVDLRGSQAQFRERVSPTRLDNPVMMDFLLSDYFVEFIPFSCSRIISYLSLSRSG